VPSPPCPECEAAALARAKAPRRFRRWAITTDTHGLIGVARFTGAGKPETVHVKYPYLLPTMLFRTRREAREAMPVVKGPADRGKFPDARVVRVSVTVQVEE
jgi:hypothetical protein